MVPETIHFLEDLGVSAIISGYSLFRPVADGLRSKKQACVAPAHGLLPSFGWNFETIQTERYLSSWPTLTPFSTVLRTAVICRYSGQGLDYSRPASWVCQLVEPLADTDIAWFPMLFDHRTWAPKRVDQGAEGFVYALLLSMGYRKSGNYRADLDNIIIASSSWASQSWQVFVPARLM